VGTDSDKHGVVVTLEVIEGRPLADGRVGLDLHAQVEDALDLRVEDVPRHPVGRDAVAQHPARLVEGLVDRDVVSAPGQLVGAGQPRRARPDDGDLLVVRAAVVDLRQRQLPLDAPIADEPLHGVDLDRAILLVAVAVILARMRADPPHHRRERVGLHLDAPRAITCFLERDA
jgi:hypothetical protein